MSKVNPVVGTGIDPGYLEVLGRRRNVNKAEIKEQILTGGSYES